MSKITRTIERVLKAEAEAILAVRVTRSFEQAVRTLRACKGKIVTTGIGKAGLIARKMAVTLCSTASPAAFVHPSESGHGDLGLLDPKDCIVAFSTSGKSREVLEMLELARHLGVKHVIGITSHPDSGLRGLSDVLLDMGEVKVPCPLGLTPSASTAVMLAIADGLVLSLMELNGVTRREYGLRHHGGYLGRKARTDNS